MKRVAIGQHVVDWTARQMGEFCDFGRAVGIGLQEWNGESWAMIAGVVFSDYNGVNYNMHVASDGSKSWMNRQFLWTVFDYPFNQAKVKRLTGLVGESNETAQLFDEHLGFRLEAVLEDCHPSGDLLIYRMTRDMCRFLNIKHGTTPSHRTLEAGNHAASMAA